MSSKFWIYWVDVNTKFTSWQKEESIGHSDTTLKSFLRLASRYLDTMKSSYDLNKKCARHMNVLNPLIIQMLNLRDNKLQLVWQLETFSCLTIPCNTFLYFKGKKYFNYSLAWLVSIITGISEDRDAVWRKIIYNWWNACI